MGSEKLFMKCNDHISFIFNSLIICHVRAEEERRREKKRSGQGALMGVEMLAEQWKM